MALKHAKTGHEHVVMLRKLGPSHFDASDIGSGSGKKSSCFLRVWTLKSLSGDFGNGSRFCESSQVVLHTLLHLKMTPTAESTGPYTGYAYAYAKKKLLEWIPSPFEPCPRLVEQAPVEALSLLLRARLGDRW